jgi:hypothetical protein
MIRQKGAESPDTILTNPDNLSGFGIKDDGRGIERECMPTHRRRRGYERNVVQPIAGATDKDRTAADGPRIHANVPRARRI